MRICHECLGSTARTRLAMVVRESLRVAAVSLGVAWRLGVSQLAMAVAVCGNCSQE